MSEARKFIIGVAAGVLGTTLAGLAMENAHAPEKARADFAAQRAETDALGRAEDSGFQRAVCLASDENLLRQLPEDRMVRAAQTPIYEAQAHCPQREHVANVDDGRQIYVWIPTAE